MKQLFTSYYAKSGKHPLAVSISRASPSFFKRKWYMQLAPTWELLKDYKEGRCDEDDYTIRYLEQLADAKLDPYDVIDNMADGSILLCYEGPGKFCHRYIAAEWIERGTGVIVREIVDPPPKLVVDELVTW